MTLSLNSTVTNQVEMTDSVNRSLKSLCGGSQETETLIDSQ